jgi:hypothetical protein
VVISIEDAFLYLLLPNYSTKAGRLTVVVLGQPTMDRASVLQNGISLGLSLLFLNIRLTLILQKCFLALIRFLRQGWTTDFFFISICFLAVKFCLAI